MPGRHVTDQQMRLFMTHRQTHTVSVAAAKAGVSQATGYRLQANPTLPYRRRRRAAGGGQIRWLIYSRPRLCHCCALRRGSGLSLFMKNFSGAILSLEPAFAAPLSDGYGLGTLNMVLSKK
jgi:hypothetical protein